MPMTDKRRRPFPTALTERQRAFVREYLTGVNATEAARRAGYSPGSASRIAYALLRHPQVAALIEQGNERRAEKRRITADRVVEELGRMAFANIRDYVDWNSEGVKLRDKSLLDPEETAAIADIEPKGANGQLTRLKLYDKLAALNALARHLGMIGGKTALGPADESEERKAANAELRERLMRIVRSGDKKA
jgi:phage terminase small subunit